MFILSIYCDIIEANIVENSIIPYEISKELFIYLISTSLQILGCVYLSTIYSNVICTACRVPQFERKIHITLVCMMNEWNILSLVLVEDGR